MDGNHIDLNRKVECNINEHTLKLFTPKELQQLFGMGKNQVYALMNSSAFPTVRINNRMYVEEGALRTWLNTYKGRKFSFSY